MEGQEILMVALGRIESPARLDLRHDRGIEDVRLIEL